MARVLDMGAAYPWALAGWEMAEVAHLGIAEGKEGASGVSVVRRNLSLFACTSECCCG